VPIELVDVVHGDTGKIPFGMGTYASRSLAVGGSTLVKAIDKVVSNGKKIAAHGSGRRPPTISIRTRAWHRWRPRLLGLLLEGSAAQVPKVRPTLCWRGLDSNFQYASTMRWHRATDLPLPPTVKRPSAGRPPPMARPRSEAQRGSVRPAAAMRSTDREMRCSAVVQAARYRAARRAAMRSAHCEIRPSENVTLHCCPVELGSPARNSMILNGISSI
jgi:hypothetical protein